MRHEDQVHCAQTLRNGFNGARFVEAPLTPSLLDDLRQAVLEFFHDVATADPEANETFPPMSAIERDLIVRVNEMTNRAEVAFKDNSLTETIRINLPSRDGQAKRMVLILDIANVPGLQPATIRGDVRKAFYEAIAEMASERSAGHNLPLAWNPHFTMEDVIQHFFRDDAAVDLLLLHYLRKRGIMEAHAVTQDATPEDIWCFDEPLYQSDTQDSNKMDY